MDTNFVPVVLILCTVVLGCVAIYHGFEISIHFSWRDVARFALRIWKSIRSSERRQAAKKAGGPRRASQKPTAGKPPASTDATP